MFGKRVKFLRNGVWEYSNNYDLDIQTINIKNESPHELPKFAKVGDSGFDFRAWIKDEEEKVKIDKETDRKYINLKPLERRLIHTGIYMNLPMYTELQIRPRSGCSYKQGLTVINTPGTIDEQYTNEICILVINLSNETIKIKDGERIAQGVLMPVYNSHLVKFNEVEEIEDNPYRNKDGMGSSGTE